MFTPQNQPEAGKKLSWSAPAIEEISTASIQQQEEEVLQQLLNSDEGFRLLTGSVTSDHRLKEDKQDFDALGVVEAISAYDFAWKGTGQREFGFMAHEIQSVLPYIVTGHKDQVDENGQPIIQRVNYAKLTPILLKAIQQQQQMILGLQAQINHLKSLISEGVK